MTERTPPLNLQNATTHTAAGDRALIHSIFQGREGVVGATDLAVSQNGSPNMSVNVAAGRGVVFGDTASDQQLYHIWNDATVNKTISAADPTNPRRDLIVAEVRDHFMDGGGSNDWRLRVITGTPAGSPADPALPNNCLLLARVAVAAAASSITNANITDLRNKAGTVSTADVICTSTTRPPNPFQGMKIYETDTYKTLVYTTATTGWQLPWGQPWGFIAAPALANTNTSTSSASHVDIPGLSITWTAIAGRRYRVRAQGHVVCDTANRYGSFALTDGAGLQMAPWGRADVPIINASAQFPWFVESVITPSAGSRVAKVMFASTVGGLVTVWNNVGYSYITVEDVGPSANPT